MSHEYPYSQGDRLSDRNTYSYSEFRGPSFLVAWRASRDAALAALPRAQPQARPERSVPDAAGFDTAQLLAELLHTQLDPDALADRLLQRFEVSKRIYRKYDADFRAVRDSGYDRLELYLLFAGVCVQRQHRPDAMRFLNALLKLMDSLISQQQQLDPAQAAALAWLIGEERAWVARIAAEVGVEVAP